MLVRTICLTGMFMTAALFSGCTNHPDVTTDFTVDKAISKEKLPDFSSYSNVKEKKKAFFAFIERLADEANREIKAERSALLAIREFGQYDELDDSATEFLQKLATKYRLEDVEDTGRLVERLLVRVAPVPPSLAMAQAANESAWGTSRFAVKGNNLFGQWCFSKGCGIVPEQRAGDAFHEVASFKSPYASVRSYMLNIHRHDAYQELRRIRAEALKNKGFASGTVVAGGLESYSERGHEYIDEVRSMIRFNKLGKYDQPDTSDS